MTKIKWLCCIVIAWHVRLKQYYSNCSEGIKHSRVVTGLTTQQLYKEKSLPGAAVTPRKHDASRKRKNSKSDKDKEKKRVRTDSDHEHNDSKVQELHDEHKIENGHCIIPETQVTDTSQALEPIVYLKRELSEEISVKTEDEMSAVPITALEDKNHTEHLDESTKDILPDPEIKVESDAAEIKEETL